ncbi:MAG: exo-alpha-sialidase, partial [Burkholderiales bacterium]|nr:exo-alpha-sialidase [Burkholderiales bacterium]
SMTSACRIARIATAALALLAPMIVQAIERCDKNHFILSEPCIPTWTPVNSGLTDLDVRVVAVDPVRTTTLYAGGPTGVFKSVDGGVSWNLTGLQMAFRNFEDTNAAFQTFDRLPPWFTAASLVAHLAIDSRNPNTLFAATNSTTGAWYGQRRLLKSTDGGETWTDRVSPGINGGDNIVSLVLAPSDPATLYLANFDGIGDSWSPVVRTTDRAATWAYLGYPILNVLAVDPLDSRTIYAGTFDFDPYFTDLPNGVLKSSDGGETWAATGLTGSGITALTVDPRNSRTLYAATGDSWWSKTATGLFKSVDGGDSWARIDNRLVAPSSAVSAVVVDPRDSNNVYVATRRDGISRSTDGGATWAPFSSGLQSLVIHSLVLVAGNPNTLYAGTPAGVFKATD